METAIIVAIIAAVPPTLVTVFSLLQNKRNHATNTTKLAEMTTKIDEVHTDTNSNYNRQRDEVTELKRELAILKESLERYRTL